MKYVVWLVVVVLEWVPWFIWPDLLPGWFMLLETLVFIVLAFVLGFWIADYVERGMREDQ